MLYKMTHMSQYFDQIYIVTCGWLTMRVLILFSHPFIHNNILDIINLWKKNIIFLHLPCVNVFDNL